MRASGQLRPWMYASQLQTLAISGAALDAFIASQRAESGWILEDQVSPTLEMIKFSIDLYWNI